MGGRVGFDFTKCVPMKFTRVKEIQIAPVSVVEPSPTRALASEGLGTDAQLSEGMATET